MFNVQGNSSGGPLITYRGVNLGTAPARIDIQNIRPGNGGQSNVFLSTNELNKNILGLYEGEKAFRIGVGAGDATTINPVLNFLELSAQGFNSGGPPNNFVRLRISGNGVVFSDSRGNDISYATPGIQYAADYSSSYTSRSLPDKNYVDTRLGGRALFNTTTPANGQFYTWDQANSRFQISGPAIFSGAGTPEGVITAPVGSLYTRTDGGVNTTLYVKQSGAGNAG